LIEFEGEIRKAEDGDEDRRIEPHHERSLRGEAFLRHLVDDGVASNRLIVDLERHLDVGGRLQREGKIVGVGGSQKNHSEIL